MDADRFARFLPLAGVLIGLLFFVGLALTWGDPSSEAAPAETFSYWHDNRGQHQISGLLLAPLIAFLLVFFGAGLQQRLRRDSTDSGHGAVAFGGALLAAAAFALVGMLEAAATNAARLGNGRHRSIAPHPARILWLLPRSALADRGRAHPQPCRVQAFERTDRAARHITASCARVASNAPTLTPPASCGRAR